MQEPLGMLPRQQARDAIGRVSGVLVAPASMQELLGMLPRQHARDAITWLRFKACHLTKKIMGFDLHTLSVSDMTAKSSCKGHLF